MGWKQHESNTCNKSLRWELAEWEMNEVWKLRIQIVINPFRSTHSKHGATGNKTFITGIPMIHPNTCLPCPGLWEPVMQKKAGREMQGSSQESLP